MFHPAYTPCHHVSPPPQSMSEHPPLSSCLHPLPSRSPPPQSKSKHPLSHPAYTPCHHVSPPPQSKSKHPPVSFCLYPLPSRLATTNLILSTPPSLILPTPPAITSRRHHNLSLSTPLSHPAYTPCHHVSPPPQSKSNLVISAHLLSLN